MLMATSGLLLSITSHASPPASLVQTTSVASGWGALGYTPPAPGTYDLPSLGDAEDAPLVDERGLHRQLEDILKGKLSLLSFFYGTCNDSDGCPLSHHTFMQLGHRALQDDLLNNQFQLLSISFDPERDHPAMLHAYGNSLRGDMTEDQWRFLTTKNDNDLSRLLRAYDQSVEQEIGPDGKENKRFAHSLRVYLIDHDLKIRNIYSTGILHHDLLLTDLRTLALERNRNSSQKITKNKDLVSQAKSEGETLLEFAKKPQAGIPSWPNEDSPTAIQIGLGKKLFFDRRLSHNDTMSCAMCHVPEQGFANNEMALAVGIEGRKVRRNAPTILNSGLLSMIFHDGRENSLEQQIWAPLLAHNEMANPAIGSLFNKIQSTEHYPAMFADAYLERGLTMETFSHAIASYERTLRAADSAFDQWLYKENGEISAEEELGFVVFQGKGGCAQCHTINADHASFSDESFHNTGIGYSRSMFGTAPRAVHLTPDQTRIIPNDVIKSVSVPDFNDLGRYEVTGDPNDRWKFRTPSLRNVALTAPYMHDGSLTTLEEVVEFYDRGGIPNPTLDPKIRPLGLSPTEKKALVSFLRSLTSPHIQELIDIARRSAPGNTQTSGTN
jgi:cytochrome c peroxidase